MVCVRTPRERLQPRLPVSAKEILVSVKVDCERAHESEYRARGPHRGRDVVLPTRQVPRSGRGPVPKWGGDTWNISPISRQIKKFDINRPYRYL